MDAPTPLPVGLSVRPIATAASRGRRIVPRPVPQCSAEFAHLSLDALRTFRKTLTAEEDKVSYWRRIIQARLDVLRAGPQAGPASVASGEHLRPVLTDARVASTRKVLIEVLAVDDIPPLPKLAELWERQVPAGDDVAQARLEEDLLAAERQLSVYRQALHRQIGEATGELIARYRDQPDLCLSALPLGPRRRVVSA